MKRSEYVAISPSPETEKVANYGSVLSPTVESTLPDPVENEVEEQSLFSFFTAYCFSVNYILGVGVLGVPYAFVKAGYAISPPVLCFVTALAMICAHWIPEVLARAEGYVSAKELTHPASSSLVQNRITHHRRFEISELCGIFLGLKWRRVYDVCISIYFVGALWSYAAVFASSLAQQVPLPHVNGGDTCDIDKDHSSSCRQLYLIYLSIFACIVVPITCLEFKEQKSMQIFLAVFRFVALLVMTITSIVAIQKYPNPQLPDPGASAPYYSDIKAVRLGGLTTLLPIAIYGQIFHHSVPGLVAPMENKDQAVNMLSAVLITTFSIYNMVGLSVSLYYGSVTDQQCSLNWNDYKGSSLTYTPHWASFISYLVVLFPCFDIVSAFPLNAITLGNSWIVRFVQPQYQKRRLKTIPFRLMSAIIPIVGAAIVSDLAQILDYTGTLGIIIAFVFPSILQWKSTRTMQQEYGAEGASTVYSHPIISSLRLVKVVGSISIMGFFTVIIMSAVK